MTIRRRLTVSYLAILLLLGANLVIYSWSDSKRQGMFKEVRDAIDRQNLINAIESELRDTQRQVTLLGQTGDAGASGGASPEEIQHFKTRLDALNAAVQQFKSQATGSSFATVGDFAISVRELTESWGVFYANVGRDQAKAITEMVVRSEPLGQKVVEQLLP